MAVVPMESGQYGIMANHCNMVAAVVAGDMHFTRVDGTEQKAVVSAGMIKVEDNEVVMLVNRALTEEEAVRYEEQMRVDEEMEIEMLNKHSAEFNEAEAMLRRTIYKLKNKREVQ